MTTTMQHAVKKALGWVPRLEPRRKTNVRRLIVVHGKSYSVFARSGYLHAIINGRFGWNAIYAETYEALTKRVKYAMQGGQ